jgi:hypothetical protein
MSQQGAAGAHLYVDAACRVAAVGGCHLKGGPHTQQLLLPGGKGAVQATHSWWVGARRLLLHVQGRGGGVCGSREGDGDREEGEADLGRGW